MSDLKQQHNFGMFFKNYPVIWEKLVNLKNINTPKNITTCLIHYSDSWSLTISKNNTFDPKMCLIATF